MADRAFAPMVDERTSVTEHPRPRTVVVVDDHRTFAHLLHFAIDAESGLRCLGVAYDLVSGITLVGSLLPDVVVMDYEFHGDERDGVTATAAITARHPHIRVVLLTGGGDHALVSRAAQARASLPRPIRQLDASQFHDGSRLPAVAALLAGGAGLMFAVVLLLVAGVD